VKVLQVSTIGFADPRYYRSNEFAVCRSLAKLGHEVTLLSSNRHPKWQHLDERWAQRNEEVIDGFTIRRFQSGPEFGTVPTMPFLLKEILDCEWDIIHAHTILAPSSFYSALASRIRRKPLIVTQHDYIFGGVHGPKLFLHAVNNTTFGRFTMHSARVVIGLSSEAAQFVQRFGATRGKTRVVPNSVDTTLFRPNQRNLLRERWGIEGRVVLFIGRLVREKRCDLLIRAFSEVVSTVPDSKLVIVGKGPEERHLRDLERQLSLRQVFFLGRVARDEMPYVYPGCDLIVLPSLYEPFGNVVLEAMATGLPVIGTKIGGMTDTIAHGQTGYHISPGDTSQLSDCIRRILTDETLRSKLSRSARDVAVERYDDMVVARTVEGLYYACLKA
jgi:glycosyltransferase involved in cell wall biosynthesis